MSIGVYGVKSIKFINSHKEYMVGLSNGSKDSTSSNVDMNCPGKYGNNYSDKKGTYRIINKIKNYAIHYIIKVLRD